MKSWKNTAEINLDVVYFNYRQGYDFSQHSEVYVWDLDKTYLDTSIDSLKGLFRTIFEKWNAFFCMETPETWISALEKVPMQIPELKDMFKPLPQV